MKMTTYRKVIALIIALLVPIIALYGYSNQVSINVVKATIEDQNRNRLAFSVNQMDMMIDQLMKHSISASRDYSIMEYMNGRGGSDSLKQLQRHVRIVDMLNMQTTTSAWSNQIILYLLDSKEVVSTDYSASFDEEKINGRELGEWTHESTMTFGIKDTLFSAVQRSSLPGLLVEVRFNDVNLKNMLSSLQQGEAREPFLYNAGQAPILNYNANFQLVNEAASRLDGMRLPASGSLNMTIARQQYIVNYIRSESIGWYLVDVVPLESAFAPIHTSRNLFYMSIGLLMALGVLATLLLYRNVQRPIQLLLRGVQRIKDGQFSARLKQRPHNEFEFLFSSFNEMAEQIEGLIDKVYKESLRAKEATLKQLQSQINPHFLYNCLFYIKNMANLGDKEAVVAMSLNLGEYYRYTTRLENAMTTLKEELALIENYLNIQSLRIQRFRFEIDVQDDMLALEIPRLLLQPLAENAVIHGVENSLRFGVIRIKGESEGGVHRIIVDDNGPGLSMQERYELQKRVAIPMDEQSGCGLWNIHQRLIHLYGGKSGLYFSESPLNGLRVEMVWERKEE
ncbi:sensor histidine kinase [Paenibacillus arenilitoris]|uniref:Histidine kinase n=1 Tax=Paenibacillus arenilitoris TaxID=2772299 RepID=A0A927CP24_9BACL|nr:histidine kinase [Paenibacillus arenilitoris]MBD2871104.1 histidine kinase [Paenibacillus arenilitoris]